MKPATQENLADVQEDIHADLSELTQKVDKIEQNMATKEDLKEFATNDDLGKVEGRLNKRMSRVEGILESILKIVQSIEGRLKDMTNHEDRLKRIERAIFFKR